MPNQANLEKDFIEKLMHEKTPVSIFLKNGIKLTGLIVGADEEMIFLKNVITQAIYKHAVSTIVPGGSVTSY